MLRVGAALEGYAIKAEDGEIGTVSDFLFDDRTWKVRWMVVDTGHWLTGRKVLVHPSAIGQPDHELRQLEVRLSKAQVEGSPDIRQDEPVSLQMERDMYGYYGWNPLWGGVGSFWGYPNAISTPLVASPIYGGASDLAGVDGPAPPEDGDPHLRSVLDVSGYHILATDGSIGHIENLLLDDTNWGTRYLIIDTSNWWAGQHVLLSPFAVMEIRWGEREIRVNLTRVQIRESPPWQKLNLIDQAYQTRLHTHYGWPGYGW